MRDILRWAVYFAPRPDTPLARFGADWLGWDAEAGQPREGPDLPGLPRPRAELTATPRKYGFHGTLKAPFRLAAGQTPAALDAAIAAVAADFPAFALPLRLAPLGRFLALVPPVPSPPLEELAAACVTRLDGFRAPPGDGDGAPDAGALGPIEAAHLVRWGYPFVLDRFRFHLTVTGPLTRDERAATAAALAPALAPLLAAPVPFADICLFGQDWQAMFHLLRRFPLAAGRPESRAPPAPSAAPRRR